MSVQTHVLPNGFRIVTEHMPGLRSAAIGVWVDAGGRHETPEQNGIAHFLEHMAFKGTTTRSALKIAEAIEDVGGYINAYTSREMTAYYARVLEADVTLALEVIGDILLNPVFDPKEIEVERGVILQEIGQALDTPDDVVFDWLQEVAYPGQAIGRTILGPAERIRAFSRQDLLRFTGEYYGPGQMILAAAGAVDHEAVVAQATALFGGLAARKPSAFHTATFVGGEKLEQKKLEQAHFTFAVEAPGYRHDDVYAAQVYAIALGGGMSSRLFQNLRESKGLCYAIFAQTGAFSDTGMLTIYAGTSAGDLRELSLLTMDEIRRAAGDLRSDEVDRARAQMKAGLLMGLESPSSRAERLARMLSVWGRVPGLDETIARIDAVDLPTVRRIAEAAASPGKAALALYGPLKNAPGLSELTRRMAA